MSKVIYINLNEKEDSTQLETQRFQYDKEKTTPNIIDFELYKHQLEESKKFKFSEQKKEAIQIPKHNNLEFIISEPVNEENNKYNSSTEVEQIPILPTKYSKLTKVSQNFNPTYHVPIANQPYKSYIRIIPNNQLQYSESQKRKFTYCN